MARKLLLSLIFSAGNGQAIGMYVRNSEPGMIKFTNQWYLFHRDGKLVLKNLEKGLVFETSDDFNEPMDPKMIDACIALLREELGFVLPDSITTPVNVSVDVATNDVVDNTDTSTPDNGGVVETINPEPVKSPEMKPGFEGVTNEAGTFPSKVLTPLEKARATKAANAAAKKAAK